MRNRQLALLTLGLIAALLLSSSPTTVAPSPTPTSAPLNPTVVMLPMPDGVRLATDVYLPDGPGPWPTILVRTPYSRRGWSGRDVAPPLLARGYAVVAQDTRGRFESEGTDDVFLSATQDGQATLRWIAAQPWSDGRIATWGPSALGIVQYMLAPNAPDALRCQLVALATPDLYSHAVFPGGVFRQSLAEGWLRAQGSEFLLDVWRAHALKDAFWEAVDISGRYAQVHVPALHIGGWYDVFAQGTLDAFVGYQTQGGPGAAGQQYLIMGPWTHMGTGRRQQGELTYPPNAEMDLVQVTMEWFDACLLGREGEVRHWPAVRYYLMGDVDDPDAPGNEWREADAWPLPTTEMALYLHGGGVLSTAPPPAGEPGDTLVYDPADPSPTVCGANLLIPAGPCDQRAVEARHDALVYSTPPLESPLEVTGRVRVRLWLVSDAPDTDLAVRLTDVYPDGRSMLVTDGILRASFRSHGLYPEPMVPGRPYELEIDIGSTAIAFNAGHRVRIIITASNAPRFAASPAAVTNTVLHDAAHPSALLLPVVTP